MICDCHGAPMLWQKDDRLRGGGYWRCREKRRVYNQTRSAQRVAWVAAKRERDPVYRITMDLASRRRKAIQRMAARHSTEEENGALSLEGRC